MGRGRSKIGGGGGGGGATKAARPNAPATPSDFQEAFAPGKDFVAVGGADHTARTVSARTQREWEQYAGSMYANVSSADEAKIMRDFDPRKGGLTGYVRTQNSFKINEILYDPKNAGKSIDQMFSRKADRDTVKTLDKAINNHVTPADGAYFRFSSPGAIQATFSLSDSQMNILKTAQTMTPAQLRQLNKALSGSVSHSKSYTSTSANRSLNAFNNPNAKQSKGFIFERKISVPKGTKAYAPRKNAQESEVLFGRGVQTKLTGITVGGDGHIVLHEVFTGYK